MIVVKYLLLKMSVGVIRDKLQHKHSFVISRQGLYRYCSIRSAHTTMPVSINKMKIKIATKTFCTCCIFHCM